MPKPSIRSRADSRAGRLPWMSVMIATREPSIDPSPCLALLASGRGAGGQEPTEQLADMVGDLVADPPDRLEVPTRRVLEIPILVALSRVDRTSIPTTHRDHGIRGPHHLVRERLRELLREIDAHLGHRLDHGRIDLIGRIFAGGANVDAPGAHA